MNAYPKLLLLGVFLLAACDDDTRPVLSDRDLLLKHDWIVFTVIRDPEFEGEPDPISPAWIFYENSFSTISYTGLLYEGGAWNLEGDVLTMSGQEVMVLELTKEKLVYEDRQGTIITRLPVKKILM